MNRIDYIIQRTTDSINTNTNKTNFISQIKPNSIFFQNELSIYKKINTMLDF